MLLALLVLGVGMWLTGWIARRIDHRMEALGVEITLRRFLRSLISLALKVLVVITVASMLGVATTLSLRCWVPLVWRWGWLCRAVCPILPAVCC